MKTRSLIAWFAVASLLATAACSAAPQEEEPGDAEGAVLEGRNLGRGDFGLQNGEFVLTLDDGPGARTKELVDYLVAQQVPAVFFMVGKNANANMDAVNYVAANSARVPGGLLIGNHSLTHTTPLPKQGAAGTINEIMTTDGYIKDAMQRAQAHLPNQIPLFRPPYGAFTALGAAGIAEVNRAGASKYMGPIFWEVGGELKGNYSADWACWGKVTIEQCMQGYLNEAKDRGKGIILAHDVHAKTIDMLTGKGLPNNEGLIVKMRKAGYKFVGLRDHDAAVQAHRTEQARHEQQEQAAQGNAAAPSVSALANVLDADGHVEIVVESRSAHSVLIQVDREATQLFNTANGGASAAGTIKKVFAPGNHLVTVEAHADMDGKGDVVAKKTFGFTVAAPPLADDAHRQDAVGGNSACVRYDRASVGREFVLFHGETACNAADIASGKIVDATGDGTECYRFQGTAVSSKEPRAVAGNEWQLEYDVSYAADPNDRSKLTVILESESGDIVTGKRHSFSQRGRADVPFDDMPESAPKALRTQCEEGIWRGQFQYANGGRERFFFQAKSKR